MEALDEAFLAEFAFLAFLAGAYIAEAFFLFQYSNFYLERHNFPLILFQRFHLQSEKIVVPFFPNGEIKWGTLTGGKSSYLTSLRQSIFHLSRIAITEHSENSCTKNLTGRFISLGFARNLGGL